MKKARRDVRGMQKDKVNILRRTICFVMLVVLITVYHQTTLRTIQTECRLMVKAQTLEIQMEVLGLQKQYPEFQEQFQEILEDVQELQERLDGVH